MGERVWYDAEANQILILDKLLDGFAIWSLHIYNDLAKCPRYVELGEL